jgi:cellulose synthase/poly-beta-1,6-N-acetylglucosamine synthase-like glycosyltransferase
VSIGHLVDVVLVQAEWAVLAYFVLVNSFYAVLLVSAGLELRDYLRRIRGAPRWRLLGSAAAPGISILAPAYDEAATIEASIRSLLSIYYPSLEVVVINDGSRDETVEVLRRCFDLVPVASLVESTIATRPIRQVYRSRAHSNLLVVDKENGGKADALNVGLNVATKELVCAIDADTLIEADALQRMVQPFLEQDGVVAAGGTVRVVNGSTALGGRIHELRAPTHFLPGVQVIEYLRAYLFGRLGWNRLGGNLIISGAFGLFRRDAVAAAGGYVHDTVGEDIELVVRLRRRGVENGTASRVAFVPDPVAWTEVPESIRVLSRQRDRWHRGLADVMWRHRSLVFNPKYGALGLVVIPYFVFVELIAPIVEALGIVASIAGFFLGAINYHFALLFFLLAYGYGLILTFCTLVLEEVSFHRYGRLRDQLTLVGWAVLENLGYRQCTVVWRLHGLVKYLRGRKDWGAMERRGVQVAQVPPPPGGSVAGD